MVVFYRKLEQAKDRSALSDEDLPDFLQKTRKIVNRRRRQVQMAGQTRQGPEDLKDSSGKNRAGDCEKQELHSQYLP